MSSAVDVSFCRELELSSCFCFSLLCCGSVVGVACFGGLVELIRKHSSSFVLTGTNIPFRGLHGLVVLLLLR